METDFMISVIKRYLNIQKGTFTLKNWGETSENDNDIAYNF